MKRVLQTFVTLRILAKPALRAAALLKASLSFHLATINSVCTMSSSSISASVYDALVIGSGQAGTPLARALAGAGKKTAMVERWHVGGTCVNVGCTPTKTMIASGRVAYMARRAGDYGVELEKDALKINMETVRRRKRDIVKSFSGGSEQRLRDAGVDIIWGEARFTGKKEVKVKMNDGGEERTLTAELIFLNVGDRPARPDLPGLDAIAKERVLDSTSIMELGTVPDHLVVLGGGYVGVEFAQLFRRLGAKVTIVHRAKQLLPREDGDVARCVLDILTEDGIDVRLETTTVSVEAETAASESDSAAFTLVVESRANDKGAGGQDRIRGSHLLLAAGRIPNTDTLGADAAGITLDGKGYVVVDERLATTAEGIYCLGDCHGGPAFTHTSYDDFRIVRHNLVATQEPRKHPAFTTTHVSSSRRLTPYVVYMDPQVAHVGLHDRDLESLRQDGRKIMTAKMPMSYVARALETDETRGIMKAAVDGDSGEILGFTCVGIEGGEIMAVVQTAMMGGVKWWDLESAVWAHPSLAESLNNLWGFLE